MNAAADKQRTGALDAVNFMCTDAHQVNFELFDVQRNFPERLNRIDVNERGRIFLLDRLKKLFNRLNRAQFVVDSSNTFSAFDESFLEYLDCIIVYSRTFVGFKLKCGLTLKEEICTGTK